MMTALDGPKLYNGMIFGLSETFAAVFVAWLMNYMDDRQACLICSAFCFVCNIIYRLLGAGDWIAMLFLFFAIFGVGGLINTCYILIEMRVPPETLGANMVMSQTIAVILCSFSPYFSYLPQPLPLYIMLILLLIGFIALNLL